MFHLSHACRGLRLSIELIEVDEGLVCESRKVEILLGQYHKLRHRASQSILTWRRRYPDPQGGSPMARPVHCTLPGGLTYAIFPNVEDSGA